MITPSFALTATERVLPRMALDFTTANLDSRVTFTRTGNTATVVNSSGLIASINANLPRFDHNPNTLVCKGLLIEEARTNNITYSSDFSDVSWVLFGGATVSTDTTVSPDGTQNADTVTVSGSKYIEKVVALAAGTYCFFTFYKLIGAGSVNHQLTCAGSGSTNTALSVDLTTGAVSVAFGTPIAFGSEIYGSWVRVWVVGTHVLGAIACYYVAYTGDVSVPIWGAQLESGAFPTSYIPTEATAVTRNADVATMTGTNFSDWYNASGGAITVEATQDIVTNNATIVAEINNNTFNERMLIALDSPSGAGTRRSQFAVFAGGVVQAQIIIGSTFGTTGKNTSAYLANNFATAQNGAAVGTDLSGTVPTVDRMYIGCRVANSVCLNGWVRKIFYYPQRLVNAEVQAFSN